MLIGFTVEPYKKWSPAKIIGALRHLGVRFFELNCQALVDAPALKRCLGGTTSAFHLPLLEEDGWDFSCIDETIKINQTIDLLRQYHRQWHLRHFIAHPPELHLDDLTVAISEEAMFANLRLLPAPIYFENVPSWEADAFAAFLKRAQQKLQHLYAGICFDAAHFYIGGDNPIYRFRSLHPKIGAVHLSDCLDNEDAHLPFGCGGSLPITDLLTMMRACRYRGSITLEMMPYTTDQLLPFVRSYLLMLRTFDRSKYLFTLLRLWNFRRLIKSFS